MELETGLTQQRVITHETLLNHDKAEFGDYIVDRLSDSGFGLKDSGYTLSGADDRWSNSNNSYIVEMKNNGGANAHIEVGGPDMFHNHTDSYNIAYGIIEYPGSTIIGNGKVNTIDGVIDRNEEIPVVLGEGKDRLFIKLTLTHDVYNDRQNIGDYLSAIQEILSEGFTHQEGVLLQWLSSSDVNERLIEALQ